MRRLIAASLVLLLPASLGAQTICHAENDTPNFLDNVSMGGPNLLLAVKFTASATFNAGRIEVFTGEGSGSNTVAIWSHDAGLNQPLSNLSTGSFNMVAANSWQGADLPQSVALVQGTVYWMVWGPQNGSQASIDVAMPFPGQEYRGSFNGGASWSGPFQFNDRHWKFRIFGDCGSCPGVFIAYGSGCGGAASVPVLSGTGCPSPGQVVTLSVSGAPASAPGILFLGTGPGAAPVVPGCLIQVLPLVPATIPVATGAGGGFALSGPIPPGTPAFDLYLQVFLSDALAPAGVSATNPLQMHIQ